MLSNRMEWAVARRIVPGATSAFGGAAMPTSACLAAHGARKPRITDAGYAQGEHRAWKPPV